MDPVINELNEGGDGDEQFKAVRDWLGAPDARKNGQAWKGGRGFPQEHDTDAFSAMKGVGLTLMAIYCLAG